MLYRRFPRYNLWEDMERLQREMNRLLEAAQPSRYQVAAGFPAMNIWSNEENLIVTAELPGVDINDIDVNVIGDTLTLSGARTPEKLEEGARYHRQERGHGKFTRSLQLPFVVDADKVEATLENGVLRILLPRAEADKPRKISVKTA